MLVLPLVRPELGEPDAVRVLLRTEHEEAVLVVKNRPGTDWRGVVIGRSVRRDERHVFDLIVVERDVDVVDLSQEGVRPDVLVRVGVGPVQAVPVDPFPGLLDIRLMK